MGIRLDMVANPISMTILDWKFWKINDGDDDEEKHDKLFRMAGKH